MSTLSQEMEKQEWFETTHNLITVKHKTFGGTNDATSEGKHQCQLTPEVLARMMNEAKQRLTDNKVFPKNVREESARKQKNS